MDPADTGDLQRAKRLEALGALATMLAPEHIDLVTVALAGLERARDAEDPARRRKELDRVEWAVQRAAGLMARMVSLARLPLDRATPPVDGFGAHDGTVDVPGAEA